MRHSTYHAARITQHVSRSTYHAAGYQYLLFDLDETLYPRTSGLMGEIARRIVLYMTGHLGFAPEEANRLRKRFLAQYGTTLRGLQMECQVDTDEYLRFVHDVRLEEYIAPNPALDAMLGRIQSTGPTRLTKVIFTNADGRHARRVLACLGVTDHFSQILDVRTMEFHNKPDLRAYEIALRALDAEGPECILVEDNSRNLRPAKEHFGMTTVLVDGQLEEGVDVVIGDLLELESVITGLVKA